MDAINSKWPDGPGCGSSVMLALRAPTASFSVASVDGDRPDE